MEVDGGYSFKRKARSEADGNKKDVDMKLSKPEMKLSRIEIVKRHFNEQNQCVREEFEYYYPVESENKIGFQKK